MTTQRNDHEDCATAIPSLQQPGKTVGTRYNSSSSSSEPMDATRHNPGRRKGESTVLSKILFRPQPKNGVANVASPTRLHADLRVRTCSSRVELPARADDVECIVHSTTHSGLEWLPGSLDSVVPVDLSNGDVNRQRNATTLKQNHRYDRFTRPQQDSCGSNATAGRSQGSSLLGGVVSNPGRGTAPAIARDRKHAVTPAKFNARVQELARLETSPPLKTPRLQRGPAIPTGQSKSSSPDKLLPTRAKPRPLPGVGHTQSIENATGTTLTDKAIITGDMAMPKQSSFLPTPTKSRQLQNQKPAFSTYLQSYSPTKRTPSRAVPSLPMTTTSPSKLPLHSKSTFSVHTTVPPSTESLRAQSILLNYHFMHQSAASTLSAYTANAYDKLHDSFCTLQDMYKNEILPLERRTREDENLLALHAWSGGNAVGMRRKLSVLTEVLARLVALTAPSPQLPLRPTVVEDGNLDEAIKDWEKDQDKHVFNMHEGAYNSLVAHFEGWITWVEDVWNQRDLEARVITVGTSFNTSQRPASSAPTTRTLHNASGPSPFTTIDGLGDGVKLEIRAIAMVLQSLASRLNEAKGLPFDPNQPAGQALRNPPRANQATAPDESSSTQTTPETVYNLTKDLLAGMQEELQLMRELECEVVLGEQAWIGTRLERLASDIQQGF